MSQSVKIRQIQFLINCLDELEDQDAGKWAGKRDLLKLCLEFLIDNERLTTKDIVGLAEKLNLKVKIERTYRSWLEMFSEAVSKGRQRFCNDLATYELNRFPGLKKFAGGGSGNETYFYIDIDEGFAQIDGEADENTAPKDINTNLINYRKTPLDSQPAWVRLASSLVRTYPQRNFFLAFSTVLLALLCVFTASALVFFGMRPTPEKFIAVLVLLLINALFLSWFLFFYKLFEEKIRIIDAAKVPAGICFLKFLKLPEPNVPPRFIEYSLEAWLVTADCPVCFGRARIQDSVSLTRKSVFDSEIIGICINNPKMHKYTFDKDTMCGSAIKKV
tara:strand:+ start:1497 stop:2492 length:996 start_codon:yes stop_codon:yes gene_type:complete